MGYRSEVGIALYTKDYKTMLKRVKELKKNKESYELIKNANRYSADNGKITILYFSDVKWYADFKEVQWIENFIKKVQSVFIRIGEELDDNEETVYNEGYDLLEYCFLTRIVDIAGEKQLEEDKLLEDIDRRI